MKKIHFFILAIATITVLQACKKNHYPYPGADKCPQPADCQLASYWVSARPHPHATDTPVYVARITRDGYGKPVKYHGQSTFWTYPATSLLQYNGGNVRFVDSAAGFLRAEAWLNKCGQPDSTAWYANDEPGEYVHRIRFHYDLKKRLTGFSSDFGNGWKLAQITRDQHGNVTRIDDGSNQVHYTYDYSRAYPGLSFQFTGLIWPHWGGAVAMEQLGFLDLRPKHLLTKVEVKSGDYRLDESVFSDYVIHQNRVLGYKVNGYSAALTWDCSKGGKW